MSQPTADELYEEAKRYLAERKDDKYIAFQLADKGVSDQEIDAVIARVKKDRKAINRAEGIRLVILG